MLASLNNTCKRKTKNIKNEDDQKQMQGAKSCKTGDI